MSYILVSEMKFCNKLAYDFGLRLNQLKTEEINYADLISDTISILYGKVDCV